MNGKEVVWAFDIGSRSIGWAVMAADEDGSPTGEVLDANVLIHSGGILEEKTGTTRHAARGVIVRNRRRLRQRRKRKGELQAILSAAGIQKQAGWRDRNPWWARSELARAPIQDLPKVKHLLAVAILHMARHRGWRNPWLRAPIPAETEVPGDIRDAAEALESAGHGLEIPRTLGGICWALIQAPDTAKIRQNGADDPDGVRNLNTWVKRVFQEHIASELATIWAVQQPYHGNLLTPEFLSTVAEAALHQVRPGVPLDRIGPCDLDSNRFRAPKASLSFQRYRALSTVANIRVAENGNKRALSEQERDELLEFFSSGRRLPWSEIEADLGFAEGSLVHSDLNGTSGPPPVDAIQERLSDAKIKGIGGLRKWWAAAPASKRDALLALAVSDRTIEVDDPETADQVAQEIEDHGLLEAVEILGKSLPPGRAKYSRQVLNDLNAQMEAGSDLHGAIERTYGHGAAKAMVRWDDPVPHVGVERSMRHVRHLIDALERRWGAPRRIGIEIVRDATASHDDRRKIADQNKRRREARQAARKVLQTDLGIAEPTDGDISKMEHLIVQSKLCLYCGDVIHFANADLDHIVPRSTGGATVFENIAAVCRPCNHRKADRTFATWCEADGERGEQRFERTMERLDHVRGDRWKETPKKPFIDPNTRKWVRSERDRAVAKIRQRLKKKSRDREFDESDLHSTAYVAREVRARLEQRYPTAKVRVVPGYLTAAMRREGRLSTLIGKSEIKARGDRRHHAVDAVTVALLTDDTWALRVRKRDEAFKNFQLGLIDEEALEEVRRRAPVGPLQEAIERTFESGPPVMGRIVPTYERRLATRGRIHEDTVRPWQSHRLGDAWDAALIASVFDPEIRSGLWRLATKGGKIVEDPNRTLVLTDGSELAAQTEVKCAIKVDPDSGKRVAVTTWIPVRKGWSKSDQIHHARVVRVTWSEKGKTQVAPLVVPVPLVDVYGVRKPLGLPLTPSSVAYRSHLRLARILAVDPDATIEKLDTLTQGDVLDDAEGMWRVTTFDPGNNRAETIPAVGDRDISKRVFVAAKFDSGLVHRVARDDLGHIMF